MNFIHQETNEELIPLVQQIIAYRERELKPYDSEKLKGISNILAEWRTNKNKFIKAFNNRLICEYGEVSVKLENEQKAALIKEFLSSLEDAWEDTFPDFTDYEDEAQDLIDFLTSNEEVLFSNKTSRDFEAPDGTIISAESKISKSFKHFFDNPELVRQLQDKFSLLIQQDKMTGTLCMSIHPLDFLSSSENTYKWRSCHVLNGEYAGGNVSYMMDKCTVMFYLKGAEDTKLPRFPENIPWNNKKWRMLAFLSNNNTIVWAGRQYPFTSDELLKHCHDMLVPIFHEFFTRWSDKYEYSFNGKPLSEPFIYADSGFLMAKHQLIKDALGAAHFNDLLYSSYYTPKYAIKENALISSNFFPRIKVGHTPICACCGEEKSLRTNVFSCSDCETVLNPPICPCCHKEIDKENLIYVLGIGNMCKDCFNSVDYEAIKNDVLLNEDGTYNLENTESLENLVTSMNDMSFTAHTSAEAIRELLSRLYNVENNIAEGEF